MTHGQTSQGNVVVVFGSTGTAGTGAIHACLAEPRVSEVRAVTRRRLGVSHAKLREVHCSDFANLGGIAQQLRGVDCCLFCLGASRRHSPDAANRREPLAPRSASHGDSSFGDRFG